MTSFLTSEAGFSITDASNYTSAFFASMLITRILCGAFARPRYHRIILWMSLSLSLCCFVIGRLTGWYWLLPLTGLFGPFFPLYVTWASLRFPERDRALVIWMLSGMQAALCVMNTVVGRVADAYGFKIAYWIPALMIISAMILLRATARLTSDSTRDNSSH
jgi:predicted MFS family arabinose efflux permease